MKDVAVLEGAMEEGARNFLLSYVDWPRAVADRILHDPRCNLLVDSGAFSAWNKGKNVNIERYAAHCEALRDSAPQCGLKFVNFDMIPSGKNPSRCERWKSNPRPELGRVAVGLRWVQNWGDLAANSSGERGKGSTIKRIQI
jgi:hypothetical protein